ncbi:MAG: AAA family ATPase [Actinomycetota bacterium]|nr:AAA family ATPase [Actinomycetota bacterium]
MLVTKFRVTNYKSFRDSGYVRLGAGFNVIVGRNNVGKTALVEALSLRSADKPHRSPETVPIPSSAPDPVSRVEVSFELSKEGFVGLMGSAAPIFYVPLWGVISGVSSGDVQHHIREFLAAISERNVIEAEFSSGVVTAAQLVSYGERVDADSSIYALPFEALPSGEGFRLSSEQTVSTSGRNSFMVQAAGALVNRVYHFKAERLNVGEAPPSHAVELTSDASNLAQCLHTLQGNPVRFQRLNGLVSEIFPEVKQITAPLTPQGPVRILVWTVDPTSEREDLAVPLSESGTGIGQVLAMLYVVLTSDLPKTIIIDEPQSFLHPGAIRKLVDILRHYQRVQHQYVITTHSPTAITAAAPRTILLVKKEEAESTVELIDASETRDQDLLLKEVGARLSDVFGADDILWVEGPTEEACFPLILSKVSKRPLLGTKILGVVQTGDFESKHSDTILEIYRRLSEGRGLLPPAVGFVFDREDRSESEREDLVRQSRGKVSFTNRRMYENYLLNPCAIAAVSSEIKGFSKRGDVEFEEVEGWLEGHRWKDKYFEKKVEEASRTDQIWLNDVHGAKLLKDLFQDLSETRVSYDKVIHGSALTRWLCDEAPEDLEELARLIEGRLERTVQP